MLMLLLAKSKSVTAVRLTSTWATAPLSTRAFLLVEQLAPCERCKLILAMRALTMQACTLRARKAMQALTKSLQLLLSNHPSLLPVVLA